MNITTKHTDELKEYVKLWIDGDIPHLFLRGAPGTGKTYLIEQLLEEKKFLSVGDASPFELYKRLYIASRRKVDFLVLDDVNRPLKHESGLRVLKELLGSADSRRVSWHSNRTGKGQEVPSSFMINCQVCVITNDFSTPNSHVQAVVNRCFEVEHLPEADEMLDYAHSNGLITKQIRERIQKIGYPLYLSLRDLVRIKQLDALGKDWVTHYRAMLREEWEGF